MIVLVCVDGTNSASFTSAERANSHVNRMYTMHPGNADVDKFYFDGPGTMGMNTDSIRDAALTTLLARLRLTASGGLSGAVDTATTVDLIGFSRGGFIVTLMALELRKSKIDVRFLGLFDAVDRTLDIAGIKIPSNVRRAAHAMRSPERESRENPIARSPLRPSSMFQNEMRSVFKMAETTPMWVQPMGGGIQAPIGFGHTATEAEDPSILHKKEFVASHGAMGGVHSDYARGDPQAREAKARRDFEGRPFDDVGEGKKAFEFVLTHAMIAGFSR